MSAGGGEGELLLCQVRHGRCFVDGNECHLHQSSEKRKEDGGSDISSVLLQGLPVHPPHPTALVRCELWGLYTQHREFPKTWFRGV